MPLTPGSPLMLGSVAAPAGGAQVPAPVTLNGRATILRNFPQRTATRSFTDNWVEIATDVPCQLTGLSRLPFEGEQTRELKAITYWEGLFALGTDLRPEDRVRRDDLPETPLYEVTETTATLDSANSLKVYLIKVRK